jgi:hypothetical protein
LQAIDAFLKQDKHSEIAHFALGSTHVKVLVDIRRFLYIPHVVQEIVSAEKTPTLSLVIPMYKKLVVMLNDLKRELPELSHAISASVIKLDEYLAKSRRTKLYALAIGK